MSESGKAANGMTRVAAVSDVPPNRLLQVDVGAEHKICLANADGRIYAFRDNCTHRDFPLSAGTIDNGSIECVWHGARFDIATGKALRLPAIKPVQTYEVHIDGDDILIELTDD
jgi:3-phenylpropionate/trans-cinnamate dioxygenase ferredoxin component